MLGFRQAFFAVVLAMLSILHIPAMVAMAKSAFAVMAKSLPKGTAIAGAIKAFAMAMARMVNESKLRHMWRTCKNASAKLAVMSHLAIGGGSSDQRAKKPGAFSGMLPTAFIARSEGAGFGAPSAASC